VSADIIILPVVRGLNEPEAIEIDDALLMARAGAMCAAANGVSVSLSRVELWFDTEAEAQEFFQTAKQLRGRA
jgi:hypothetical protein